MYTQRLVVGCATIAVALLFRTEAGFATQPQKSQSRVAAVLENITNLNRPGQDGYATVWDGNKYVQCKRLSDRNLRCEAAGSLMQSSLGHVLTPERVARLTALGWRLDPSFGNYVQTFPADAASSLVATKFYRRSAKLTKPTLPTSRFKVLGFQVSLVRLETGPAKISPVSSTTHLPWRRQRSTPAPISRKRILGQIFRLARRLI
jgi:hypothetical protein